jgi:hypothetical protein
VLGQRELDRRWDGSENDVLIGQKHSPEDHAAFLRQFPPRSLRAPDGQSLIETTSFRKPAAIRLYRDVVALKIARDPGPGLTHPGVMLAWDNSARRPIEGRIVDGATAGEFKVWFLHCVARARPNPAEERFVSINSWNEWAEGTYLEPNHRYGCAFLAACAEVVREEGPVPDEPEAGY